MARFFVNRPIVAMVISIITIIVGLVAMSGLPIAQYPEVVPPMVQITTTFVGASATDVEASVATPIEQKLNGVEKGIYMKSTNANDGTMTLKVSFEVGSNLDMDNVLAQNRVSEATPMLPQSVKNYGVAVKKALPFPLLIISIKSPKGTYDNNFLSNYATINVNDAIARIPGVGQINLFGGSDYAMRVWLRPDRIAKLAITVPDIVERHQPAEPDLPRRPDRRAARGAGNRVHLHREDQGAPARREGVRRHRRPYQPRRLAGVPQGRGAARARYDAVQLDRSPQLRPVRGHRRLPDSRDERTPGGRDHQEDDGRSQDAFPARHGVPDLPRHHPAGRGGHQRDRPHPVRGGGPGHPRGLRLPPELARDPDPAGDRAGLADRRVHLLPDARLLDQRALAARPGARHRHRRGRRDRRGRGGHAPSRARHAAEGGHPQGHGGGLRPRGRDRPRPLRGVRARGLHGRHHRDVLPAVRDHDRALRAPLRDQRPHPEPGARGPAAEGADGPEDAPDAVLQLVQQGLRPRHRRLRQLLGHPDPEDGPERDLHPDLVRVSSSCWGGTSPRASSPRRTRAT